MRYSATSLFFKGVAVSTQPKELAAKPAPEQERYMPGDPIPVPDAVEANTESTWALFSDVPRPPEPDFLDTIPSTPEPTGN